MVGRRRFHDPQVEFEQIAAHHLDRRRRKPRRAVLRQGKRQVPGHARTRPAQERERGGKDEGVLGRAVGSIETAARVQVTASPISHKNISTVVDSLHYANYSFASTQSAGETWGIPKRGKGDVTDVATIRARTLSQRRRADRRDRK